MESSPTGHEEVAVFTVRRTSFLDRDGQPVRDLPEFASDPEQLQRMYRAMVLTRVFDAKTVALQRTGRLGTFASSLGQEAVAVGVAAGMTADDVLVPSFREQGAMLWRDVAPEELLLYWGGDERGSDYARQRGDFPVCVPIGTQAAHATGVALAFQLRARPAVAVCVIGDGATSRGDVYESMNFAGVRHLPVVYVVDNNQWAISVPRSQQSAATTLAQKAIAAGFPGEQVDGNDVVAVRAVVGAAVERARTGGGPSLIEALTYRLSDHTTADDASRYRSDDEVTDRWTLDPVARLRDHLVANGWWGRDREQELLGSCTAEMERAVAVYESTEPMPPASMFDHLYAELPDAFAPQRAQVAGSSGR